MKILYISKKNAINKTEALTWFQQYCDNESDLRIETNFNQAKDFLTDKVIEEQKHLDLIITDWEVNFQDATSLLSWLREVNQNYSDNNFQIRALPILLIEDTQKQSSSISEPFNGTIKDFPNNHGQLTQTVKSAIRSWRYDLADDLDLIGLDPETQKIYPNHRSNFISYYKLKVLTKRFVDNKSKRLNYIWTNTDIVNLNETNNAFIDKMDWAKKQNQDIWKKNFTNSFFQIQVL